MSQLERNLMEMERSRERYWLRYPQTSPVKLRWRALTVRHSFHILPGESVLELGAGSGLWTEHLAEVLRGENPLTAAIFNSDLADMAAAKSIAHTAVVPVTELATDLPEASFDYVVGTAILCHNLYGENLGALFRLLKDGGQLLFFEANYWNPQVFVKSVFRPVGRLAGNARCQIGMRKYKLLESTSREGFVDIDIIPYDLVHPSTPRRLIRTVQSLSFLLEHVPGVKELCGTLYIWAKKPGDEAERRPKASLAHQASLFGSTSVVVPCRNESANVRRLIHALLETYGDYLWEIVIVDDNSEDDTAAIVAALGSAEPRVKLVRRHPPPGVGRALRDGYAAATGEYILSMDCDFHLLVPELRDLFDAVAAGHDGAVGSRFSYESVVLNYPVFKIFGNRAFHLLVRLLLGLKVRDVSNNLKLYKSDVLKTMEIRSDDFAANAETGLVPLLAGYDIKEVPISWIGRSRTMGQSSFRVLAVAPGYAGALQRLLRGLYRRRFDQRVGRVVPAQPDGLEP